MIEPRFGQGKQNVFMHGGVIRSNFGILLNLPQIVMLGVFGTAAYFHILHTNLRALKESSSPLFAISRVEIAVPILSWQSLFSIALNTMGKCFRVEIFASSWRLISSLPMMVPLYILRQQLAVTIYTSALSNSLSEMVGSVFVLTEKRGIPLRWLTLTFVPSMASVKKIGIFLRTRA